MLGISSRNSSSEVMWEAAGNSCKTKSIINDLGKKGVSSTFSEASRRTIKELGNIELDELGEISKTVQCPSCLKYSKEGTVYLLLVWNMSSYAFGGTDRKDQHSI